MYRNVLGKVTMTTKEYRNLLDEIANLKVAKAEAQTAEYHEYKRTMKAEAKVEHLMQFILSDADINNKFREYEVANAEAKK
jgi:hypothetical protein